MKVVIGTDCTGSCKSNYHTITTVQLTIIWEKIPHYNNSSFQNPIKKQNTKSIPHSIHLHDDSPSWLLFSHHTFSHDKQFKFINAVRQVISIGIGILLTSGNHLHDRTISPRGEVERKHKTKETKYL
jgi:hypothetical protein